ncbi:MAG: hypothetical protein D3904_14950, partial [Candidatus Electrothrix sp. EH2]|nr:hypothetical protein [Candidatus Electrothrix sp. EH2]
MHKTAPFLNKGGVLRASAPCLHKLLIEQVAGLYYDTGISSIALKQRYPVTSTPEHPYETLSRLPTYRVRTGGSLP